MSLLSGLLRPSIDCLNLEGILEAKDLEVFDSSEDAKPIASRFGFSLS